MKERSNLPGGVRTGLLSLAMLLVCMAGYAQTQVTGCVTDEKGEPLAGVSVVVRGTSLGVISDTFGNYSIKVPSTATLEFTFIGMVGQSIPVNNRAVINVVLEEDVANLEESVVIGYGVRKRAHLTGSVASVSQKDMLKTTASNISMTLVGKLPGLITQQATGAPGSDDVSMLIRGYSSYNTTASILVLVDGVERTLNQVDPNDVESVTILKDAASTAVYGMKAANGVLLVTTKHGSEGTIDITYRGSTTLSHATMLPKMMNGTQYMQWYNYARELDGNTAYFTDEEIAMTYNGDTSDGFENTDWTSTLYKTTIMHQHSLSVNGGNNKVKYYISGGYLNQNGIISGNKLNRYNFRSNVDIQAAKNLKVGLSLAALVRDYQQPGAYSYGNQQAYSIFHQLLYSIPFVPKEYQGYATSAYRGATSAANPVYGSAHSGFNNTKKVRIETSANLEYSAPFLPGLKVGAMFSWDWQDTETKTFSYTYELMAYDSSTKSYSLVNAAGLLEDGNLYQGDTKTEQILVRPNISYNKSIGKHDFGALFLYEATKYHTSTFSASRTDFDLFDQDELMFGDPTTAENTGSSGNTGYAAFVGRLNYAYNNKYLAEFAFRYDGSYKFAKGHRWGFFPSLSLGWVMSEEDFFKTALPKINHFKIRASAGMVGNDNVTSFMYRKSYSYSTNSVAFGSTPTTSGSLYSTVAAASEDLTWEKTSSFNFGFDLTAWNGLLGAEFDIFYQYTWDILQATGSAYSPSLGGNYPTYENSGKFDNRGFELVLKHSNRIKDFTYNLTGNISYAHNRILSQVESANVLPWQSVLGTSLNSLWGYHAIGLYQSEEEIENSPTVSWTTPRVGDIKYEDVNGDGVIDSDDMVKISNGLRPEMMFAFMADFDWKGFDLSIQFQGAALADKMLQYTWQDLNSVTDMTPLTKPWYAGWDNSPLYLIENSWTPENTDAKYPRLSANGATATNNAQKSDFWKVNGSYLRLKNVVLGYTIPKKICDFIGVSHVRVYCNGTNLFTITEFKYIDPESTNVPTGYYPQQRTYSFGLEVKF